MIEDSFLKLFRSTWIETKRLPTKKKCAWEFASSCIKNDHFLEINMGKSTKCRIRSGYAIVLNWQCNNLWKNYLFTKFKEYVRTFLDGRFTVYGNSYHYFYCCDCSLNFSYNSSLSGWNRTEKRCNQKDWLLLTSE